MNNANKTNENVRNHRDIKIVTTESRRNYLRSEPDYDSTKFFTNYLLAIETKNRETFLKTCLFRTFNTIIE